MCARWHVQEHMCVGVCIHVPFSIVSVIISMLCTYFTPSISESTYFSHTYIYASDFEFFLAVFALNFCCLCLCHRLIHVLFFQALTLVHVLFCLMCIDISATITFLTKSICRDHLPEPGVARESFDGRILSKHCLDCMGTTQIVCYVIHFAKQQCRSTILPPFLVAHP